MHEKYVTENLSGKYKSFSTISGFRHSVISICMCLEFIQKQNGSFLPMLHDSLIGPICMGQAFFIVLICTYNVVYFFQVYVWLISVLYLSLLFGLFLVWQGLTELLFYFVNGSKKLPFYTV